MSVQVDLIRCRRWICSGICWPSHRLSRGVIVRLRIPAHIIVRVHPLHVPLNHIRHEKHTHHRVIISRIVIVQPRRIPILPGEALGGAHAARLVPPGAVGPVNLITQHGRSGDGVAEGGQDAA